MRRAERDRGRESLADLPLGAPAVARGSGPTCRPRALARHLIISLGGSRPADYNVGKRTQGWLTPLGTEHPRTVMLFFVVKENIIRFRAQLNGETDPAVRAALHKLLVEEEHKLGINLEHLADIDREISEGRKRIARQRAMVERLDGDGRDAGPAKALLGSFMETQAMYVRHRQRLMADLQDGHL